MSRWIVIAKTAAALAAAGSAATAELAAIKLKNGAEIRGDILKERPDTVAVDVGFTVLNVPRSEITAIEKTASARPPGSPPAKKLRSEDIYFVEPGREELPVEQNVPRVSEAVVQIQTASGLGSGFIINRQGHVITNQHVISGEREMTVVVYRQKAGSLEKESFTKVRILAMNGFLDLALLQIDDPAARSLPHVPVGDSDAIVQGERVFAIGSPLGLERTVSQGIVSIKARESKGAWSIQSTTQINPGNSGGPLFNMRGEVIGVNNMKLAGVGVEGLGFSIPSSLVKLFLKNRDAFAFDPRNPNSGFRYLGPPAPKKPAAPPALATQTAKPKPPAAAAPANKPDSKIEEAVKKALDAADAASKPAAQPPPSNPNPVQNPNPPKP